MTPSSKILVFDERCRERQKTATFLDKASQDFNSALNSAREQADALRGEADPGKRSTAVASLERKLQDLDADHRTIVNAHKRLLAQLRDERAAQMQKIEGLLSYGIACGMSTSADRFIVACLKDARETRNIEERERLWAEADLALPAAIEAAEAGYGVKPQTTDTNG